MNALAILNISPPYGSGNGQEALDLALATASFGQQISLFFAEDGVFQLVNSQNPTAIEHKNYSKTFAALEFYDIEDVYVCTESLQQRQLSTSDLCIEVCLVSSTEMRQMLLKQNTVLRF